MEHINSFTKGLTSDMNIAMQPDGTWRYMNNCNVISQDGKNYEVKDALGNVRCFALNVPYETDFNGSGAIPMPIGFISFADKLIVFSTNNNGSGGYLEIGMVEWLPYGEGIQPYLKTGQFNSGYIPLYHHANLNCTWQHRIEGFSFNENELTQRIYWTDNYNQPRTFNVSDPRFTDYIPTGSLVDGVQYMVVEGVIQYGGVQYGAGLGNVFTATTANTSFYTDLTSPTPTAKVITYYPYELLDFIPERALGGIQFSSYGTGNLYCGNKIYFYRLSNSNGIQTSWSYASAPIHVGTENDADYLVSVNYHNFVGGGTTTTLLNSGRSVNVQLDNLDTNFDFVELACAEFDASNFTIRQITIVNRVEITATTMIVAHTGNTSLGELTNDAITLFPANIETAKTLTTNKNYILLANTTERQEFDFDVSTITAASFEYPMLVHNDADSCTLGAMVYDTCAPSSNTNPVSGTIKPWERYVVVSGGTVTYNGNPYAVGEVFTGVTGVTTYSTTGTPVIRPVVTRNRYTTSGGDRRENYILLKGDGIQNEGFWDYKDPANHNHAQGYWSGEKYRFAIVFFDKKGNPYYAKWIADYTFPSLNTKGGSMRSDVYSGDLVYSLNPSGIKFSGITIPPDVANEISGFSIMRAIRDPRIIGQGLVTQCTTDGAVPPVYRPAGWIPVSADSRTEVSNVYSFICPDDNVGLLPATIFGQAGDGVEEANWYSPFVFGGGTIQRAAGGEEQVYSKIFDYQTTDGRNRNRTIEYFGTVDEGASLTNIGDNGEIFLNDEMTLTASAVGDPTCTGGPVYNLNGHSATGCRKNVFTLDSDFPHYGTNNGYTATSTNTQTEKIIMNYVKSNVNSADLYGGSGEDAKANTVYISTGHFQPIDGTVLSETFDGTNYVFNDVEVFGGDCYTCLIDVGYGTWSDSFADSYSYAWTFPCECSANYGLRRGRKTSNVEMYYTGTPSTESIVYLDPSSDTRLESYSYNLGYSAEGGAIVYPALPVDFINAGEFPSRVHYAGEKILGETIDSFRTFGITDFKDISAQSGRINNLKVIDDTVLVFQDWAINTVPVLERQVVSSTSGAATIIGTGGVVDRWDVVSSYFGNQHQWSVVETEYGLAWFDMHRKAFLTISKGQGVLEVSQALGMQGFFSEVFLEAIGAGIALNATDLLNSPTYDPTSDMPLMGVGITGVYDPKLKMTYLCFKFKARQDVSGTTKYQSKDFTIGYLNTNTANMFVGFFDWNFCIAHNHNSLVFSTNNPKNTAQLLGTSLTNVSFAVGETLQGVDSTGTTTNEEYICKLAVTLDNVAKYPLGASGSTYWTKVNQTNELWVSNNPPIDNQNPAADYVYDSFFGKVVNNQVDFIVNPNAGESIFVQAMEQHGNSVNVTDVYIDAEGATAQDTTIPASSNYYRYVFDKWKSNMPLTSKGARIINRYLRVKLFKKNWDNSPILVSKSVKTLRLVKSIFNIKK